MTIETYETAPEGFTCFGRRPFLSAKSAMKTALKWHVKHLAHIKVCIVHDKETHVSAEAWYVGYTVSK